jgi:uncharacterized protein YjbI with pentapeptide repeats
MAIVEIKFAPWSSKAVLTVEVGDAVKPWLRLRAALELVVGEVKEGKRDKFVLSGADLSGADLSGADLSGADLSGADLSGADLSGAVLRGAVLRGAVLSGADLSGADLSGAVLRGAVLSGADLSDADLRGADLRGADLSGAVLRGAVLSGADLSGAVLSDADLRGAVLSGADLRDADLRGAVLSGADLREILEKVPLIPNIDAAILAAIEENKAKGTNGLEMGSWHGNENKANEAEWCETTHCRAGYAICLAGKAGFDLEKKYGPANAGMFLYLKSTPNEPVPNWSASNEVAMADMRARAERQLQAQAASERLS